MRRLLPWLAVVGVFFYWLHHGPAGPKILPENAFAELPRAGMDDEALDVCAGKSRCLIVYIAPWCPTCHDSLPFIIETSRTLEGSKTVGMKIVLGSDTPLKLRELAEKMAVPSYLDVTSSFADKMHVEAFPTWIVLDGDGKVLTRFAGGAPWLDPDDKHKSVKGFLGRNGILIE